VPGDSIPEVVRQAVVPAEDARFLEHRGVDPRGSSSTRSRPAELLSRDRLSARAPDLQPVRRGRPARRTSKRPVPRGELWGPTGRVRTVPHTS